MSLQAYWQDSDCQFDSEGMIAINYLFVLLYHYFQPQV